MKTLIHGYFYHKGQLCHRAFEAVLGASLVRVVVKSKNGHSETVVIKRRHFDAGGAFKEIQGFLVWLQPGSQKPTHLIDTSRNGKAPHA